MAVQRTLCIIKPDAVAKGASGTIVERILREGFRVLGLRQVRLSRAQAEGFYAVHRGRGFFEELVTFMSRGPIVAVALEREDAVRHWRDVIGATDPAKAAEGTIRKAFGANVGENAVHGSDSEENGQIECAFFFAGMDLL
ncbi:MAG: nucleoside-diphosphate kinase [Myxococcota bacterium]|jgi:nucleoside-diphosphate kinase|nr:nucleoside-diphosphate kinase [Myxococcota bacterium]